jgi:hypothetical protein
MTYGKLKGILVRKGWISETDGLLETPVGSLGNIHREQVNILLAISTDDIPLWLADVKGSTEKVKYGGEYHSRWHQDCLVPILETTLQHRLDYRMEHQSP